MYTYLTELLTVANRPITDCTTDCITACRTPKKEEADSDDCSAAERLRALVI